MENKDRVKGIFDNMQEVAEDNQVAAALLTLAVVIQGSLQRDLDHTLALGIRKGLFGRDAKDNDGLRELQEQPFFVQFLTNRKS